MRTEVDLSRAVLAGLVLSIGASVAWTQDTAEGEGAALPNTGALSFDLTIDWVTAYYWRGYLQEDQGSIVQPAAEAGIALYEGDTSDLALKLGLWNSFHSAQTGATTDDSFVGDWYEADYYLGLDYTLSDWTVGLAYINYSSPSGAFKSVDELDLSLAWDDSGIWGGDFGLSPYLLYAFETHDRSGTGNTDNAYLEFGISAGHSWELGESSAVSVEVPLVLGFSIDDYYVDSAGEEDTLGYVDIGLDASYGIPFAARFGGWSLNAGVHYLSLGDAAKEVNNDDGSVVVGRIGLSISY